MQRDTTTNHPTPSALVASYDMRLAHDIERRERDAQLAQRERDARRNAYDALCDAMPITTRLRDIRYANARSDLANRAFVERTTRIRDVGPPPPRTIARDVTPNEWEAQGPHANAIKRPDRACHHPLVKCAHKW